MQGIITNYNAQKGYGFIYSDEIQEDVFVHVSNITNASELFQGQQVEFDIKKTKRGFSALLVVAGEKQRSPYLIFALISAFSTIGIFTYFYFNESIQTVISYLIAINITTFLLYVLSYH